MKCRLISVTFVGLALFISTASATTSDDNDKQIEAEKVRRLAYELTNIRSVGSSPFHLLASVEVFDEKSERKDGSYSLVWKSPGSWREDILFPDFSQVRIAEEDKIWLRRSVPYLTRDAFQLPKLMEFPEILRLRKNGKAENWRGDKRSFEITLDDLLGYRVQLDSSSANRTQIEVYRADVKDEFQDYASFGEHNFPRSITMTRKNRPFLKVQVLELTEVPSIDATQFTHSPDARWFHWCSDADFPKLQPTPVPRPARPNSGALFKKNEVAIYGVIGPDGRWHNLKVVKSGGPEADTYWLNVIARQLYSPANCSGKSIETEVVWEISVP